LIEVLLEGGFFLEQAVEILEKGMIEGALSRSKGNQSEAAKLLGIHRNTLLRKMLAFGIDGKHPRRKPSASAVSDHQRRGRKAS
jgi:DNA-binding NtrC family response regulator